MRFIESKLMVPSVLVVELQQKVETPKTWCEVDAAGLLEKDGLETLKDKHRSTAW